MNTMKVAVLQMVSSTSPNDNLARVQAFAQQAAQAGAKWLVLPEYWAIMGKQDTDKLAFAEDFGTGKLQTALSDLAKQLGITIFAGTLPLRSPQENKVINSLLIFNENGECASRYDKVHLFAYSGLGERYAEADTILAGAHIPHFQHDGWHIAQGICYDLRFPEFFRQQAPYEVLVLPAAFTYSTGKAHWELLLRARAVENQCYVLASGQGGEHESGRKTFGHSMIIDPWGDVLAVLPEGEGLIFADLDKTRLQSVRTRLPALQHRVF
ncbi:MAG: carbon-nitrogen hydrolase family protein [Neisseria sp.]|nr:carbon-nitrogen hydrolase family protein [Neisseria sp.]